MFKGNILIAILVVLPAVFAITDYCNANLCGNGRKHIACNNDGNFAAICKEPEIIEITPELRTQIINKHNSYRNQIAAGFDKFPTAERMATMTWNDELAKLAELNVKQCKMSHDQCRNTADFPYAGQNIAFTWWGGMDKTVPEVIDTHIDNWFNEYKDCPVDVIKSFSKSKTGKAIGHFTALVQDKSTHVGCAILRHHKDQLIHQIMTCDYAYTNIENEAVYAQGPTASKCTTGTDEQFKSLCSIQEKYNESNE